MIAQLISAIFSIAILIGVALIMAGLVTPQQAMNLMSRAFACLLCALAAVCIGQTLFSALIVPSFWSVMYWFRWLLFAAAVIVCFGLLIKLVILIRGEP